MTPGFQEDLSQDKLQSCQIGRTEKANAQGNAWDTCAQHSRRRKPSQRLSGHSSRENLENRFMKKSQMTAMGQPNAGASSTGANWDSINWKPIKAHVARLQIRIAKAVREGHHHKAKALQWLLTRSYSAKLLAIRRITQNQGKNTPGIDGVVWTTSKRKMQAVVNLKRRGYQPQPLRRIYIPKKDGHSKRPLSIPTMLDRTQQAIHLMALEPAVETIADRNSYGFRPDRSCADAIAHCFNALARQCSATWILEGDIKSCFDTISHPWLLTNTPMDKKVLKQWLDAGYMENETFHPTQEGVPQGGTISPCLLVNVMAGLEAAVKAAIKPRDKVNVCIYADDFIITGATQEILENKVKPAVQAFLAMRGLTLSETKTKIVHISEGFDFLGFNIRKYKEKLLIKPSKASVKQFLNNLREFISSSVGWSTQDLIRTLNLKIRGWCNYYRHVVAKKTFSQVDSAIFKMLKHWIKRRHPDKNGHWWAKKYFRQEGNRRWIFYAISPTKEGGVQTLDLLQASHVSIKRHVKIKGDATPYDPVYREYFNKRHAKRLAKVRAIGMLGQLDEAGLRMARAV
jgi:RNA-directed DNA polymerase